MHVYMVYVALWYWPYVYLLEKLDHGITHRLLHVDHESFHGPRGNLEHAMVLGAGIRLARTTQEMLSSTEFSAKKR